DTYISNGPFQLKEFKMKDSYEFVKNENYWNKDAIKIPGVTYKMVTDENTAYASLQNKEFDVISLADPALVDKGKTDGLAQTFPNLGTYFLCVNVNNHADKLDAEVRKALQNKDVRNALALAIDRETIVTNVTKTGQVPSASFTPAGIKDPSGADFKKDKFDPKAFDKNKEEAKKLLEKAGYPGGKGLPTLEIMYNSEGAHKQVMEVVEQNWKEIGVNVKLTNQEWAVFLNTRNNGGYQISRHGWSADYVDPMTFLDMWVSGKDGDQSSWGNNDAHFANKEYDELIGKAKKESDPAKRFEYMAKAEQILLDEMPVIPIYDYTKTYGINSNIKGVHASVLGQIYFDKVTME
ncbi:MAG: peptide ABC transporter substrate-binding protein, partial [Clostridium sp.]|uniref:peptide ABC transporter substrate-binding protein n=1 Tax=Clostridium sp. TaxID=1506 RepID=UPI003F380D1B